MAIRALAEWNFNLLDVQMQREVEHARDAEPLPEVKQRPDSVLAGSPLI
jgi:hypothetical protein